MCVYIYTYIYLYLYILIYVFLYSYIYKLILGLSIFDQFLLIYNDERQGFGAEAPKPRRSYSRVPLLGSPTIGAAGRRYAANRGKSQLRRFHGADMRHEFVRVFTWSATGQTPAIAYICITIKQ